MMRMMRNDVSGTEGCRELVGIGKGCPRQKEVSRKDLEGLEWKKYDWEEEEEAKECLKEEEEEKKLKKKELKKEKKKEKKEKEI